MLDTTVQMYEQWEEQNPKLAHPQLAALLKWAAMLHEVGLNINHSGMHRHSAYILQNSDLPGFNREQQTMMATRCAITAKPSSSTTCRASRCLRKSSSCR